MGLSVGIWAKGNGARSRLGLGRGGGHLGDRVMAWPRASCGCSHRGLGLLLPHPDRRGQGLCLAHTC